jgi:hypothetical protein
MTVKEVYAKYRTPKNLEQHMLRVASLGSIVCESWAGSPIDETSIIETLLFHDIAKPISFDMAKQARFVNSALELKTLEEDVTYLIEQFGTNEHTAALKIFVEIGLSENSQRLINNLEWSFSDRLIEENDLESLLTIYCDMRIGPKGVLKVTERILELHSRSPIENLEERLTSARNLEMLLAANTAILLESITDEQINSRVEKLLFRSIG